MTFGLSISRARPARLLPAALWRVVPLTLLILFGIWQLASREATRALSQQLETTFNNEVEALAMAKSRKLAGSLEALSVLAGNDVIMNGIVDLEERGRYLPIFFHSLRLPGFSETQFALTDYRGRTIFSNATGNEFTGSDWIGRVLSGQNVLRFSSDYFTVAVPVMRYGAPEGAMIARVPLAAFWVDFDFPANTRETEIWDGGVKIHETHGSGSETPVGEDAWISAESRVPDFPSLSIVVRQSRAEAFAPAERLDQFMLAELILSIIAIIIGISASAYLTTKPLNRFIKNIDRIAETHGTNKSRVTPAGAAEFHELSHSLNRMLESLESTTTSRDYFNEILNSISEMLLVTDAQGRIQLANRAATDSIGLPYDALLERNVSSIVSLLAAGHAGDPSPSSGNVESTLRTAQGNEIPVQVSSSLLASSGNESLHYIYVITDITERKLAESKLSALAQYDILTGLANRHLFQTRLQEAIAQGNRSEKMVALLLLDLDNFKDINDKLGHSVGDSVLLEVANRLKSATRETDTVARLGGDEFAVIAPNINDLDGVAFVAEKLIEAVNKPIDADGHAHHPGISIGISVYPLDEADTTVLFNHADFALYQAKSRGKGRYEFFDEKMNNQRLAQKEMEADLSKAIECDEFELHYQPKLAAVSGQVTGVEALIRWRHPVRGMVPPNEFIPIAEYMGKINELSAWVISTACEQHLAWQDDGLPPIPVAVNLSTVEFKQENLASAIFGVTERHGVDPKFIELEITEGTIAHSVESVSKQLAELHELGFKISIDDFGTGYSSLAYLSNFPIDVLKIDRAFVAHAAEDAGDAAITKAIIALAHSLEMLVVAEGVETQAQLNFLRAEGCHEVQGYFFSKPVPPDELAAWVRNRGGSVAADLQAEVEERASSG